MSLSKYKTKRNFSSTPEPEGKLKATAAKLSFVVHRHKASHLHYDFRLEMEGVLKSWAVPKGPSLNPKDKRLAMMVEDHPYDYKDFKGVIPSGYGAGIVEIWDKGYYSDIDNENGPAAEKNLRAGLKAGNLKFTLHGKKLKGEFALVKLKARGTEKDNSWLLIKHNDAFAVDEYDSEKETAASSPINRWLKEKAVPEKKFPKAVRSGGREKIKKAVKPMLAKETDTAFDDPNWLFEIKFDGYRAIAEAKNGEVELYSRNGNSFLNTYPLIVQELKKLKHNVVLDGEVVILNEQGRSDFQKLQHYEDNTQFPICYYIFDVLSIDGNDTTSLTLIERKQLLKKLLPQNRVLKYSDHILEKGKDFFKAAKLQDLEGIMAKKMDSEYYPGARTNDWLKIKHHKSEDVIVVGYTEPGGARNYFGALVLATKTKNGLHYAGHTGTGFDDNTLKDVYGKLQKIITKNSPFAEKVKTNMPVTWVKPKYIAEIKFTQWTTDGKMRHPVFMQMRVDKTINDINMETTKVAAKKALKKTTAVTKIAVKNMAKPIIKSIQKSERKEGDIVIGKTTVSISHRDKIYWPEDKITKGEMIDYYQRMANYVLPYLKDRPESLKRNPGGINDPGFFHKDAGENAPNFVKSIPLFSESANKEIDYIICNDKATLAYLNNLGCIEINPWNSTTKKLDNPDYLIIDIDPSEKNTFEQVVETALAFKKVLDKAGAVAFCKTSGSTGLHIFVPMGKKYAYEQVKDFAHLLCKIVGEMLPKFTSLERNLKKRGNKNIYLDYLQNRKGQTLACAYSLRPKKGATVSAPLQWKEVKKGLHPSQFTIRNIEARVKKMGDLFKDVLGKGVDIGKCLQNLS